MFLESYLDLQATWKKYVSQLKKNTYFTLKQPLTQKKPERIPMSCDKSNQRAS